MTSTCANTQYVQLVHTRVEVDYYRNTHFVYDHPVSPVVPLRETPEDSGFRRAAVLTCEECGEDFRVGYVIRSEALRRFRSDHHWLSWLVWGGGMWTVLGVMTNALFGDVARGQPGSIIAFLVVFGLFGIPPAALMRATIREVNHGIVRLEDSRPPSKEQLPEEPRPPREPPFEKLHDWVRKQK
ncbi:hypothetical protein ACIG3E_23670 [Streptomyces sp. NPDC053474]|uniref:hypothetical protein n=1 Tax=Streptomyces sp. NPDC053474 TaxID=3365704 RepID=UPI0037D5A49F